MFFQIQDIWRTLKSKEGRYGVLDFTYHVTFEIQNAFWPFIFPILLISIMNFMIIWEYSFKYKSYGGTKSQKKVDMLPWTSNNMSRLKFMLFYPPFSLSLSYSSRRSWLFENILSNTSHFEDPEITGGRYGALNFT